MPDAGATADDGRERVANPQTRVAFEAEAATVVAAHRSLKWVAPSRDEGPVSAAQEDATPIIMPSDVDEVELDNVPTAVQGGRNRGLIIHKLFEEVLNGETDDGADALTARASQLIAELGEDVAASASNGLSPAEIAGCVAKTLALPEIAALRPSLIPELPVFSSEVIDGVETATAGIADAISYDTEGKPHVIVDWKSDVEPKIKVVEHYREQVRSYLAATGATAGLIVFATSGKVVKVGTSG